MTQPHDPDALARLLPFYVNGTLDPADRAALESALESSADLREALRAEEQLQARHREGLEAVLSASEPGFESREAALAARLVPPPAPATAPQAASAPASGLLASLAFLNPRRWHPAMALCLIVAVPAQAAVIVSQGGKIALLQDENFQLASGPCDDRPPAGAIQLELAETAQWKDVAALLDDEELSIARSGGLGMLTIKTGREGLQFKALIERLRASPLVASAEPAA
jgi:hypothetical protein